MADHWEQQVADTAQRYRRLNDRVAGLTVTERDGQVGVTVSSTGQLVDIQLPGALAAQVMACVRRAQSRIPDLLHEVMVDTVGPQDPSVHLLVDDARTRFPEPVAVPPPRRRAPEAHDEWDGPEVLDRG